MPIKLLKWRKSCSSYKIQSTLVISNSFLSNNRLSRSENLVHVLTQRSTNRQTKYCGKEEKLLLRSNFSSFPQYFQYISNLRVKLKIHLVKGGCLINCFPQFRKSDMSKYGYLEVFHRVLGFRDNESQLYIILINSMYRYGEFLS